MSSLGVINKSYVSALDPVLDTREINKQVSDIYNEDALTDILYLGDRKKPIATGQPIYYTFVNESLFKLGDTTGASVSGNGTTLITTSFTAATSGFVKVQDLIKFPDNNVGIVRSVTSTSGVDTVVIKSVSGANIAHTAGDQLSIFSVAVGERADALANERFGVTRYSNKYQIFSITSQITDVQNAATLEVSFNGQNKFIVKDHIEKALKLKGQINAAFFGGDMSVTTFSDTNPVLTDQNIVSGGGGGGAVQTTRGVDKYIELYGISAATASTSSVALADFDNMLDFLLAARAPREYLVASGSKVRRAYDKLLKNLGSSGVNSVRLMVDGKEIDYTVDKISYGGFDLNFTTMPILDHPTLFSQTIMSKSSYWMPFNKQVKVLGGGTEPAIQVRYIPAQQRFGNELIGESHSGALSPVNPTGHVNEWKTVWTSYQGLEVLGAQWFGRQRVIA